MIGIALKMLIGDRTKFVSIVVGVSFAVMLIVEQGSIFTGLMRRSGAIILDTVGNDLWVFDNRVRTIDELRALKDTDLYRVREVPGVAWATPFFKGQARARRSNGQYENVVVIGVDEATFVGGPSRMVVGTLKDLQRPDAGILDIAGAAKMGGVQVGEELTFNDHRAIIVGTCEATRNFQSLPVVYTRFHQASQWVPSERNTLSAVLVSVKDPAEIETVKARIEEANPGLAACTPDEFRWKSIWYTIKFTGIAINFGTTVILGFLVGAAIAGQTFYNFALENIKQFGELKAMGASDWVLTKMIVMQALCVAALGYGVGTGIGAIFGRFAGPNGQLPMYPTWHLLGVAAGAVTLIAVVAGLIALRKVRRVEPAIVFR